MPVGQYPSGASPYGALDMAGNVLEWVHDWYDGAYYAQGGSQDNPQGPATGTSKTFRGGGYPEPLATGQDSQKARAGYRGTLAAAW